MKIGWKGCHQKNWPRKKVQQEESKNIKKMPCMKIGKFREF
jgi:hypothetical protein